MTRGQPGKTGVPMQTFLAGLSIRPSLVAAVLGDEYGKPPSRRALRQYNGKRVANAGDPEKDALILEVRRLREQCGMTTGAIAAHLREQGRTLTPTWITSVCNYYVRSHLVPAANADSYLNPTESLA